MATATPYLLDNAQEQAAQRMRVLPRLFDAPTQRALSAAGIAPGWDCLEVGGGGGTVARWMAERVAPGGTVLCTDLDPRLIGGATQPNLRIVRHDIVRDAMPDARFDLIHARLVLMHIPERAAVLERLVNALKPNGWLVIEDFDVMSTLPDPAHFPHETELAAVEAMRNYMIGGGVDARFARSLYGRFRGLGLENVSAEGRAFMFDRASGGAELMRVNFEQVGSAVVAAGFISDAQLQADIARLEEENFAMPSPIMWTVTGRRPPSAAQQA
jgi:SAM-dependent methyltransferase